MPGGNQNATRGVLRSSAAIAAAVALAISVFVAQTPQLVAAAGRGCVTPGNDGPNAALTGVVNFYYPATASAVAGATSISVGSALAAGSPTPIAPGDLLLVIQMQDADISGTNAVTYGDGATGRGSTGLRSTGLYEYVAATNAVPVAGGLVNIAGSGAGGGLVNSYDFSTAVTATNGFRTFQVIRVPQYSSATVTAGLTAAAWNGAAHAGGILAIDVAGALNLNAQTISVNQLGFKGGQGVAKAGGAGGTGTDYVVPSSSLFHGYKGEGIAGTPHFLYNAIAAAAVAAAADGYPSGDAARGAPGNAGGGGTDANPGANDQNSGGGGGANGGQGGLGGNSWNSNQPVGGLGGAVFPAAATMVVLGGGGGAGSRNNSAGFASSGGTGGGIVMIRAGSLAGTGTITANGGVGITPDNDGGGGGGAGGSVIVTANTGTVNGVTVNANGGRGTDAWPLNAGGLPARHGPGGGGGGGVIITSNALPAGQTSVLGGAHGVTTTLADAYGSTDGNPGAVQTTTPGAIPGSSSGAECVPVLTVAKTTGTPTVTNTSSGTVASYSITVSNAVNTSPATNVSVGDALPSGFTFATTVGVVLSGGATRPATVNPVVGATNPTFGTFSIPGGGSVVITFTVNIASTVVAGTYNNPAAATYLDPTRTTSSGTTPASYPGGGPDRVTVLLAIPVPDMTVAKSHADPFVRGSTTSTYTVTATNSGTAPSAGTVTVTDTLPAGLTPTAAAGTGWTCPAPAGQTVTCTRANALAVGASYPPITVTVTVLAGAANSVVNQAVVSGGGETNTTNDAASDPTNIVSLPGLPNTSGPSTDGTGGRFDLLLLATVGLIACVAVMTTRVRSVRFRQRRHRPNFVALPVLICVVTGGLAISPLLTSNPTPSMRAPEPVAASEVGTELIGATVVTDSRPAPPVEESFHMAAGPITPARLRIPSIGVDAPVAGVGLLPDGSMAVPDNLWVSAWLSSGVRPGQVGSAVIAGHRGIGTPGLFGHLENVRAGDTIRVSDAGGGELVYQVTRVASLDLSSATQLQVFGPTAQQQLVLITCVGQYSRFTRTYDHRLVVFSRLLPGAV